MTKNPKDVYTYVVHAVDNSFKEALSFYGTEVEEIAFDLPYWV